MKKIEKDLISIIVPVYNGQKYLNDCIDSILNQDYQNIEVIIVNDGSKDKSPNIIDEYASKDERIKPIHQKNGGVSSARNAALNIAKGRYICLVDQDDCIAKNYLTYFYNLIVENKVQIALCPKANRFTGKISTDCVDISNDKVEVWSGEKAAMEMLYYNIIIGPWNKMISRDLIEANNIRFNPNFFGGEGFSFSVECFQRADRVAVGAKKVYLYRVDNSESGTTKFSLNMMYSNLNAQKYMADTLVNPNKKLLNACKYSNWHTCCDNLNTIIGCKVIKENKGLYKEMKKICRKDALCGLAANIPFKEKIKEILYFISPYLASKTINHFRKRKFTVEL